MENGRREQMVRAYDRLDWRLTLLYWNVCGMLKLVFFAGLGYVYGLV